MMRETKKTTTLRGVALIAAEVALCGLGAVGTVMLAGYLYGRFAA